ncbi:MAG: hypothetical protein ACOC4C_02075 [Fibrobacterota bacterium]
MKYIKPGVKGLSMIRQVSFLVAVLSVCSFAAPDSTGSRLSELEGKVDDILSIAGIQFGGEFRSQFLYSGLNTDDPATSDSGKIGENVNFTSVDFEIEARPNEAVGGKVFFRMHQDWRNFFSDGGNPITTRWVGINGNVNNMFLYDIGDYKQKYSPLTMYTPQIKIDYEPEIFASKRQYAMEEAFLEDNQRILQGVNLTFAAQIEPLFKKFYAQAFGARLRQAFVENNFFVLSYEDVDRTRERPFAMDRYAAGFNTDMEIIEDLELGGTFLSIFDAPSTNDNKGTQGRADTSAAVRLIGAVRGGIGTATFMDSDIFDISLGGEIAFSGDRTFEEIDTISNDTIFDYINGAAVKLDLLSEFKLGSENKLSLRVGVTSNDNEFRNELAQSPSFYSKRIMNTDNDINRVNNQYALYSTYDALYNTVFYFAPSMKNQYYKSPFQKLAYTNGIVTIDEVEEQVELMNAYSDSASRAHFLFDPALQLAMPYGPATPNRIGFDGALSTSFLNDGINAKVSFASYNESTGEKIDSVNIVKPKASFKQFGGGASIDFASFIGALSNPLRISGGIEFSSRSNEGEDISSSFLNLGFYWNIYKRFSLLAGYQNINTIMEKELLTQNDEITQTQQHWAVGLEYKIGKSGSVVTGSIGKTIVSMTDNIDAVEYSDNDFSVWQPELFLTVPF